MRARAWVMLAALLAANGTPAADDGFDHASYPVRSMGVVVATLDGAARAASASLGRPADYVIDAAHQKLRTVVVATGAERPIDPRVRGLVERFGKALRQPPGFASSYVAEIEVTSDGRRYWVPIQDVLIGFWRAEMARGDRAAIFLVHAGRADDVPVFLATRFRELMPGEDADVALRDYDTAD